MHIEADDLARNEKFERFSGRMPDLIVSRQRKDISLQFNGILFASSSATYDRLVKIRQFRKRLSLI